LDLPGAKTLSSKRAQDATDRDCKVADGDHLGPTRVVDEEVEPTVTFVTPSIKRQRLVGVAEVGTRIINWRARQLASKDGQRHRGGGVDHDVAPREQGPGVAAPMPLADPPVTRRTFPCRFVGCHTESAAQPLRSHSCGYNLPEQRGFRRCTPPSLLRVEVSPVERIRSKAWDAQVVSNSRPASEGDNDMTANVPWTVGRVTSGSQWLEVDHVADRRTRLACRIRLP